MADLEAKLIETQGARTRLIATDGAFSMDGDVAPMDEICALAHKYNAQATTLSCIGGRVSDCPPSLQPLRILSYAQVFVDECHATGFFGATGIGTPEHFGVIDKVDVINSTLGKALGGATGGES